MSQRSLPPHLLNNQQQDILLTFVFYTQGASNQLHVFNILQSTSQKATFQDFGHWRLTGTSFHTRNLLRRIIEDSSQPMTYHLLRTSTAQIATFNELCTLLSEIEANYLQLTLLMSKAIDFPGGKISNNSSGSAGQLTTSRACNSVYAGWRQTPTSSLVPSSYWGKTTRHHSSGPQPWLPTSI